MGSPTRYACYEKKMLSWICEKMDTQELTPEGGRFFAYGSIVAGNSASACSDPCVLGEDCSTTIKNGS
jgi:hypothetical protein